MPLRAAVIEFSYPLTDVLVGITTAIVTAGQNLNLAVPGNYLKPLIAHHDAISTERPIIMRTTSSGVV